MTINPNAPTLSQLIREHGYTYTIDSIESIPHYHLVPVSEVCFDFKKDHPAAECHGCEWCFPWVFCDAEDFIRDLIRPNSTLRNTFPYSQQHGKLLVVNLDGACEEDVWSMLSDAVNAMYEENYFPSVNVFCLSKYANCICLESDFQEGEPSYQVYIPTTQ